MKNHPATGPVDRDWFGLESFLPGPRFTRGDGRLYLLDEVGSTNQFLRGRGAPAAGRLCRWDGWGWVAAERTLLTPPDDPAPGTVVVARRQTAGRGRQGRIWRDCGGLHLSVAVPPRRAVFNRGFSVWLGLITVLVLREDLQLDARLKWPNDIMVERRKLGGILLERSGTGPGTTVVGGLGLNLTTEPTGFPVELQGTATSVHIESGRRIRAGELAAHIIGRVEGELGRFQEGGWTSYRPALALLDCLLGQTVRLASRDGEIVGRAAGIDDAGRLLVRRSGCEGALAVFNAGDVHILSPATDDGPRAEGETPCVP